ncbi:DUF2510 domain-containing protein [Propionibacteriaceae bacterium G1746]|uniref:DUF2510 domain-containing protein n=1 Tax=Aestuariimicrobium sp. G57 TaxID=3418485 RepID=UPI003C17A422
MADAGWYPDPAGVPGRVRWFDGSQWTTRVRQQSGGDDGDGGGSGQSGGGGRVVLMVVVAVVALALVVWFLMRPSGRPNTPEDTNRSTPTVSAWDETSTPSPPETPSSQASTPGDRPTSCPPDTLDLNPGQPQGGWYAGGGLAYPKVPGWQNGFGWGLDWASNRAGQRDEVTDSWIAIAVVGQLDKDTFPTAPRAADQLLQCMASSFYYNGFTGRHDVSSQAVTIDGKQGWKIVSEIRVAPRPDMIEGDVLTIIVLDVGREGQLAVYCGMAPIGDEQRNQLINTATAGLRVRA